MGDDYKKRIEAAVLAHHKRAAKVPSTRTVKNEKPERAVVIAVSKHLLSLGFSVDIVDSSAWNMGHYIDVKTRVGFSDIVANDKEGKGYYLEIKAPGRINNVSLGQYEFLTEKIKSNCFAASIDSVERFNKLYAQYQFVIDKQEYLLSQLPKPSRIKDAERDLSFDE